METVVETAMETAIKGEETDPRSGIAVRPVRRTGASNRGNARNPLIEKVSERFRNGFAPI